MTVFIYLYIIKVPLSILGRNKAKTERELLKYECNILGGVIIHGKSILICPQ